MNICPVLLAVLALLAACGVESEQPLSDPAQAKPDSRLAGVWYDIDYELQPSQFLHVIPEKEAWMDLVLLAHEAKDGKVSRFKGFPTLNRERNYLNVAEEKEADEQRYLILHYAFSGPDTVSFWALDKAPMEQAVDQGHLQGRRENEGNIEDEVLVLSDSGARILTYLQAEEVEELFEPLATFRRVSF
ncbi:MAG: hypothetical protein GKR89_04275 [Candidatus Latescibacteria bacterium]|nr:hypothetical protein [Candidatus Latescibacterota bacterium]